MMDGISVFFILMQCSPTNYDYTNDGSRTHFVCDNTWTKLDLCPFVQKYPFCLHLYDLGANSSFQARSGDCMVKLERQAFHLQSSEPWMVLLRQPHKLCIATLKLLFQGQHFARAATLMSTSGIWSTFCNTICWYHLIPRVTMVLRAGGNVEGTPCFDSKRITSKRCAVCSSCWALARASSQLDWMDACSSASTQSKPETMLPAPLLLLLLIEQCKDFPGLLYISRDLLGSQAP